jgi:hypothetical protein
MTPKGKGKGKGKKSKPGGAAAEAGSGPMVTYADTQGLRDDRLKISHWPPFGMEVGQYIKKIRIDRPERQVLEPPADVGLRRTAHPPQDTLQLWLVAKNPVPRATPRPPCRHCGRQGHTTTRCPYVEQVAETGCLYCDPLLVDFPEWNLTAEGQPMPVDIHNIQSCRRIGAGCSTCRCRGHQTRNCPGLGIWRYYIVHFEALAHLNFFTRMRFDAGCASAGFFFDGGYVIAEDGETYATLLSWIAEAVTFEEGFRRAYIWVTGVLKYERAIVSVHWKMH